MNRFSCDQEGRYLTSFGRLHNRCMCMDGIIPEPHTQFPHSHQSYIIDVHFVTLMKNISAAPHSLNLSRHPSRKTPPWCCRVSLTLITHHMVNRHITLPVNDRQVMECTVRVIWRWEGFGGEWLGL
jgi:hypothetical protein